MVCDNPIKSQFKEGGENVDKYEKARQYFQIALNSTAQCSDDYGVNQSGYYEIGTAIEALEKQIPKKPHIKYHEKHVIPQNYGRLMQFHCPNCGRFIVAMYENDVEKGGGIHEDLKGCFTCLQAIDFTGYYYKV